MNPPTIAAVVSTLKPQAGPASSAPADDSGRPRFAEVLAGHSAAGKDPGAADATTQPGKAGAEPGTPSAAGAASESHAQPAQASEEDKHAADEDTLSALPHIALEIASHARVHAAQAGGVDTRESNRAPRSEALQARGPASVESKAARHTGEAATIRFDLPDSALATREAALATPVQGASARAAEGTAVRAEGRNTATEGPVRRNASTRSSLTAGASATEASALRTARVAANTEPASAFHAGDNAIGQAQAAAEAGRPVSAGASNVAVAEPLAFAPTTPAGSHFPASAGAPSSPMGPAVSTPLHQAGWDTDLGRQVVMLARDVHSGAQTAELRLDPPELGPLRISISLSDGTASALFVSAHASVRHAVESALPQLSQQLAQAGISLGHTHVGEQGQGASTWQGTEDQSGARSTAFATGGTAMVSDVADAPVSRIAPNSLVDTFA